jgi:hypothetical protein
MKKLILLLLFVNYTFSVLSQCSYNPIACGNSTTHTGKQRGLYINYFFNFDPVNSGWSNSINHQYTVLCSGGSLDPLTNLYPDERTLLQYIFSKRITSIAIFGIYDLLHDPTHPYGTSTISGELRRFISIAKRNYGVREVSAVIGSSNTAGFVSSYNFTPYSNCPFPPDFSMVNFQIGPSSITNDPFLNSLRSALAVYNFNAEPLLLGPDPGEIDINSCLYRFDRMVTEVEWWHGTPADRKTVFEQYQQLMDFMHCIKQYSRCPLKLDTYIGHFTEIDGYTEQQAVS